MANHLKHLQSFIQEHTFGVCVALGDKLGIASSSIRLFFIYTSFLTLGSPIIVYLAIAFILNIKKHIRIKKSVLDF